MRISYREKLRRVTGLIELLITCHPQGFSILLGESDPPSSREIHEMMNAGRSKLPEDFRPTMPNLETEGERIIYDREYFDECVELAGGWPHIYLVAKEYRKSDYRMWNVVTDHVKFVGNAVTRYESKLGYVAVCYGLSPNTVMKYRRKFSEKFAEMLLMPTGEGENFYLIPG
ncbi:MAG: hypothetical protein IJR43_07540 [Synergistaceae bacterium]|nr:hypothetical protein [Synergistaceae bacterium]MBQ9629095.1 hypothetical protein [Synergistaceae bacterium]MBR0250916.1 hypothetical protein [Synergistaceae bacterium]